MMLGKTTISVACLFIILTLVAILLSSWVGNLLVIICLQFVACLIVTEVLFRGIPTTLLKAAKENCFRLNDSHSDRRESMERKALFKVRTDLWAVALLILFVGNGVLLAVHTLVIPIPLAVSAATAFDADREDWANNLRSLDLDGQYTSWYTNNLQPGRQQAEASMESLWNAWPLVAIALLVWLAASVAFLRFGYLRILSEYQTGIAERADTHLMRDMARAQT